MIIKKMTATFGGLDHAQLCLDEGLTVIHAPNEAGKSTWCGFLRAMLYGISTRDRDKKGYLAEKNRYQPWSGSPMEGEIELCWQGRDITLRRFAKGLNPWGGFSAVYTGTQEPVPELTADTCGQTLLGVSREVWERSAFIGSSPTLAIDGNSELERRITAMFSSGQEDVSFSQAQSRLKEWLRHRQHNRSGLIPRMEEELAQTENTLARMDSAQRRLTQAQQEHRQLTRRHRELTDMAQAHRRISAHQLDLRYAQACAEDEAAQKELADLLRSQQELGQLPPRQDLLQAQDDLRYLNVLDEELVRDRSQLDRAQQAWEQAGAQAADPLFDGMTDDQARARAQHDTEQGQTLAHRARQGKTLAAFGLILAPIFALACGGAALVTHTPLPWLPAGLIPALLLALGGLFSLRRARGLARERTALLAPYGAGSHLDLLPRAEEYCRRQQLVRQAQQALQQARQTMAQRQDRRDALSNELFRLVHSFDPRATDAPACRQALDRALELEHALARARDRAQLTARHREDLHAQGGQTPDPAQPPQPPALTASEVAQQLAQVSAAMAAAESQQAMAQGELLSLGGRAELEARRSQLLSQLQRRREEHRALELALQVLDQANARMQERFAPELNRLAGELLGQLTAGR